MGEIDFSTVSIINQILASRSSFLLSSQDFDGLPLQ